jgi:starch phosphorylase
VTNGVTPRRWLFQCNPSLSALIAEKLGSKAFLKDLSLLSNLKHLANDKDFQERFMAVKYLNKV